MNRLTRLIGRVHLVPPFAAWLMALIVIAGGAITARGQSNPFVPIVDEVQTMLIGGPGTAGSYADRWNIPGGIQLHIDFKIGSGAPGEDFSISMLRGLTPNIGGDPFDGVTWSFLSDTPITIKPFALSWDSDFYEGSQPSTGCGVGAICLPANVPTTISMDLNELTPPLFPTGDYSSVASVGFQIIGPPPPQDEPRVLSMVSVTSLAPSTYQWEYVDPTNPNLGKRKSATLTADGYRFHFRRGSSYSPKDLTNAYLANADLSHTGIISVNLTNAYLAHANLSNSPLESNNFTDADLSNANLSNSGGLSGNAFVRANLSGANLSGASFFMSDLSSANLAGANLTGASIGQANLAGSNLTVEQLYSTADYQSGFFTRTSLAHIDLSGANFSNKTLHKINFTGANFSGAIFTGAFIGDSNFADSNLTLAQLSSTSSFQAGNLSGVGLAGIDLSNVDFSNKYLAGANLSRTNLSNARLNNVVVNYTSFAGANLAGADLTGLQGTNVYFNDSNITFAQLASTAIYQLGGDHLFRIGLSNTNMSGGNFAGKNLGEADLKGANLSGADLSNAILAGAQIEGTNFANATVRGTSFYSSQISLAQLVSTASYQARDLTGINLGTINLAGANFAGQNLTNADFTFATLTGANFTGAEVRGANFQSMVGGSLGQLYSTASYLARNLTGISLGYNTLSAANFSNQNLTDATFLSATLTNANFSQANLTHADFLGANLSGANLSQADLTDANLGGVTFTGINLTGANISGANLSRIVGTTGGCGPKHNGAPCQTTPFTLGTGITPTQISATASYAARDLSEVTLANNNFNGASFFSFNLTNSDFAGTTLVSANLSGADARGSSGLDLTGALVANLIGTNGRIAGLNLSGRGAALILRDYDGNPISNSAPIPITIDNHFAMGLGTTLRMVFDADAWDSTISFAPGISVARGGKLELGFADGTDLAGQVGRTFRLFDWTGVAPTGAFNVTSPYSWNLSKLYTTGEVTLTAVPEPATLALTGLSLLGLIAGSRRRSPPILLAD